MELPQLPVITGADFGIDGTEDWIYKDISWMTKEYMIKFVDIIGKENLHWISGASRNSEDGTVFMRGSVLVSPQGIENAKEYRRVAE